MRPLLLAGRPTECMLFLLPMPLPVLSHRSVLPLFLAIAGFRCSRSCAHRLPQSSASKRRRALLLHHLAPYMHATILPHTQSNVLAAHHFDALSGHSSLPTALAELRLNCDH